MAERKMIPLAGPLRKRCQDLVPHIQADPELGVMFSDVDEVVVARLALIQGLKVLESGYIQPTATGEEAPDAL